MKIVTLFLFALALMFNQGLSAVELIKVDGEIIEGKILTIKEGVLVRLEVKSGKAYEFDWQELRSIDGRRLHGQPAEPGHFMDQRWFIYSGIGPGGVANPDPILEKTYDREFAMGFDLLGVYWRLPGRRTLVGGTINFISENWISQPGNVELSASYAHFNVSLWHAFSGELGDGFFVRLGVGPSHLAQRNKNTIVYDAKSSVGGLAGLGWFLGSKPGHRYPVTLAWTPQVDEKRTYHGISMLFGVLW